MQARSVLDGLPADLAAPRGEVCVAVLDGPVDLSHPCFAGADLHQVGTLVEDPAGDGAMSLHGTHIASVIFGRPGSPVAGLAPGCRGLIVPVFSDDGQRLSQVDLARAIEAAVAAGADIINISGGEPAPTGEPDVLLANALRLCSENGVLVVAAVGNEGTDSVQVPAACPGVLAVGACTPEGEPLPTNNHGAAYRHNAVLAPGLDIEGARPGGGTARLSGSSFATAIVSGIAAALLGHARRAGDDVVPATLRDLVLGTATGASGPASDHRLAGLLDVSAAYQRVNESETDMEQTEVTETQGVVAACADADPAASCECKAAPSGLVYAIGTVGWDFGTEARRDAFIQQMDVVEAGDSLLPANPYDPNQLHRYLAENPWDSDKVIWTCNMESRMPLYALEAETPFGMTWGGPRPGDRSDYGYPPVSLVHKTFRDAIVGQSLSQDDANYVARVSVPGTLTGRTVRLFSGQVVPVVRVQAQGLYTWNEAVLVDNLVEQINTDFRSRGVEPQDAAKIKLLIRAFLDKVYYQFRNLGQSSPDRALNYAATNVFELTRALAQGFLSGRMVPRPADQPEPLYALDDIAVARSAYCRPDQDAWDVTITFFNPENDRHSRVAIVNTVDASSNPPASIGQSRQFLIGH